jgi:16S rRNA G527 N7-methylase RsmG
VDFVIARAVAYVDKLIPWAYHLLKRGGCFLLMKQVNEEEKAALLEVCKEWKLRFVCEWKYQLFEGDIERVIYVIEKP